jgi:hypothetical protein
MSPNLSLAVAAAVLLLAGCASEPAEPAKPEVAAADKADCRGVAPATGTLLRKKEDCLPRVPMTPEDMAIDEMRRNQFKMQKGGSGG